MQTHLHNAMQSLTRKVLFLGAIVEENLRSAVESLEKRDAEMAAGVIAADDEVDHTEVDIEEECLKMLALYQPVATDLRFIVSVIKLNGDLERIGDQAVDIAKQSAYLVAREPAPIPPGIRAMGDKAAWMVKSVLDALVEHNADLARRVVVADDELDALKRDMFAWIENALAASPDKSDLYVRLLTVPRKLERIGDHATNIAEDVIYMVEGSIVRHLPIDENPSE